MVPGDGAGLALSDGPAAPDADAAMGCALDAIYAGAMAARPARPGFDRDLRRPDRLLGLIAAAGLMPDPGRVILVTGSKGKGSTARLIAAGETAAGRRTLLFTSPEETTALDRIRLDGAVIGAEDFLRHHAALAPQFEALAAGLPAGEALSPLGQFLALVHHHDMIGYLHDRPDIVLDQKDRDILCQFTDHPRPLSVSRSGSLAIRLPMNHSKT